MSRLTSKINNENLFVGSNPSQNLLIDLYELHFGTWKPNGRRDQLSGWRLCFMVNSRKRVCAKFILNPELKPQRTTCIEFIDDRPLKFNKVR